MSRVKSLSHLFPVVWREKLPSVKGSVKKLNGVCQDQWSVPPDPASAPAGTPAGRDFASDIRMKKTPSEPRTRLPMFPQSLRSPCSPRSRFELSQRATLRFPSLLISRRSHPPHAGRRFLTDFVWFRRVIPDFFLFFLPSPGLTRKPVNLSDNPGYPGIASSPSPGPASRPSLSRISNHAGSY